VTIPQGFAGLVTLAFAALAAIATSFAHADTVAMVNTLRAGACRLHESKPPPLRASAALNDVAQRISSGANLHDALAAVQYRARASRSISVSGVTTDSSLHDLAAQKFCGEITDSALTEIGTAQRGERRWIVLADPFTAPQLVHPQTVVRDVLQLVNAARAHARRCGSATFARVAALQMSAALATAADGHAADLVRLDRLTHEGSDGSNPGARAAGAGYRWEVIGENIAAGPDSAQQVVSGWLRSPEHCANIMDQRFTETGIAYRVNWQTSQGIYWVQDFAMPRSGKFP
jgi:uncharacterized protein YkwD